MEKKVYPLYLLDFGMVFKVKRSVYTFLGYALNGMIECRDKFGLIVEFRPDMCVVVV